MKRQKLKELTDSYNTYINSKLSELQKDFGFIFKTTDILEDLAKFNNILLKRLFEQSKLPTELKNFLLDLIQEEAKDPIIIGITGTVGKTSTAYTLTEYLKALGKKVTLLSSANMYLPIASVNQKDCMPVPIESLGYLKNFINLSLQYNSDYIIIEVAEEALREGRLDGIPFDIKVLTHFWSNWLENHMTNEEYLNHKLSFFTNEEDTKYFYNVSSQELPSFLAKANNPILYGTKYNSNKIPSEDINYRIKEFFATVEKQYIEIQTPTQVVSLHTKYIYNSPSVQNLCGVISVLDYLNVLDEQLLEQTINSMTVPGRRIITTNNNRTIIISRSYLNEVLNFKAILDNKLDNIDSLEKLGEEYLNYYNKIIVMDGIVGWDPTWDNALPTEEEFFNNLEVQRDLYFNSKAKAFEAVDEYYITNINPGRCDNERLLNHLEGVLSLSNKPITRIPERQECIHKVILNSQPGDVIFISGRASYDIYQNKDNILFYTDEELILNLLEDLKWL